MYSTQKQVKAGLVSDLQLLTTVWWILAFNSEKTAFHSNDALVCSAISEKNHPHAFHWNIFIFTISCQLNNHFVNTYLVAYFSNLIGIWLIL